MAWVWLLLAAVFEVVWAVGLKWTDGFTRVGPTLVVGVAMVASVLFLGLAARSLPMSLAYPVWTGIGVLGVSCCGMLWLHEPVSAARIVCILCICIGVVGLKLLES